MFLGISSPKWYGRPISTDQPITLYFFFEYKWFWERKRNKPERKRRPQTSNLEASFSLAHWHISISVLNSHSVETATLECTHHLFTCFAMVQFWNSNCLLGKKRKRKTRSQCESYLASALCACRSIWRHFFSVTSFFCDVSRVMTSK